MHLRTYIVDHGSRLYVLEAKFEIVNLFSVEEIAAFVEKDLQIKVVGPG
jgi:hypothetical protein